MRKPYRKRRPEDVIIHCFIFNYQRKDMLLALLCELKAVRNLTYTIIDDGSDYCLNESNMIRFPHEGKQGYWKRWDSALAMAKHMRHVDMFVFLPNDFSRINIQAMIKHHLRFCTRDYAYNIINDGRTQSWNKVELRKIDADTNRVGFCDCGFFCNYNALYKIGFHMTPVGEEQFFKPENSSGVGKQLTRRMIKNKVTMYLPTKSMAYHGDHPSVMHPEHRKQTPLISR